MSIQTEMLSTVQNCHQIFQPCRWWSAVCCDTSVAGSLTNDQ